MRSDLGPAGAAGGGDGGVPAAHDAVGVDEGAPRVAKRARDDADEEARVTKRADALPDALRLNCTDAVAAASSHLMRVLAALKNLQTVHCAAEGARARVTVPRPVGLLPMQLAPVLAVLGAHRATHTAFSAAEPNALCVDDAPAFDAPPQVAAAPARALAAACRVPAASVREDLTTLASRLCPRVSVSATRVNLSNLLNYADALAGAWLDVADGRIAFVLPPKKRS